MSSVKLSKDLGVDSSVEEEILNVLTATSKTLYLNTQQLKLAIEENEKLDEEEFAQLIAKELQPLAENIADLSNKAEKLIANELWSLPTFYDMLFVR